MVESISLREEDLPGAKIPRESAEQSELIPPNIPYMHCGSRKSKCPWSIGKRLISI